MIIRKALAAATVLLLSACASAPEAIVSTAAPTSPEVDGAILRDWASTGTTFKIGNTYSIAGETYKPVDDLGYREEGVASWYGPGFDGKATANGEVYDQRALTAAHRTLALPTVVKVTNLENGRSVIVKVNDRGPFAHGRIIDMSERGAELLDFKRQGTARVAVEVLPEETSALRRLYVARR